MKPGLPPLSFSRLNPTMNTIEEIPLTILGQVVQGFIFTMLGIDVDPLRIELAPDCLKDADAKSRWYAESILQAMEQGKPLPTPATPWQIHVHAALGEALKKRIEAFLIEGAVLPNDRIGRLVKSYLSDTSLDGTFHDFLRHGTLRTSRYGYGWIARLTHDLLPQIQARPLTEVGRLWLRAYRASFRGGINPPSDSGGAIPM